jgi:hypothetical protein
MVIVCVVMRYSQVCGRQHFVGTCYRCHQDRKFFWVMKPRNLMGRYRRSGGTCWLHLEDKGLFGCDTCVVLGESITCVFSIENSSPENGGRKFCRNVGKLLPTTRCYSSQDSNLNCHRCENFKYQTSACPFYIIIPFMYALLARIQVSVLGNAMDRK